ncbi:conjugal transfer protein TraF [Azohydromonas aeria]|uniref:conjugal transfer protein TraF n=1 Tax=Azohydromonas aeria TaxID=2590212 RepID=UPI001E49A088|nr:conjugal transfer protein TraF [Azohydromonas aeria]
MALLLAGALSAAAWGQGLPDTFWADAWRGWHFYEDPAPDERPPAPPRNVSPPAAPASAPARPVELAELDRLRQALEDARGVAVMRPTEANVRRYMELEARVVARASAFADVARRVAWTTPGLDPTLQGRPVNARALEVFEERQAGERSRAIAALGRDHVLLFFFRGDCPYCHAFAPTLQAFQQRHGLRVEAVSLDGGAMPGFAQARRDNGTATALRVTQVPAVYLAQPFTGRIVPIGFGVMSESQLVERIAAAASPDFEALVPGAVHRLARP